MEQQWKYNFKINPAVTLRFYIPSSAQDGGVLNLRYPAMHTCSVTHRG